MRIAPGRREEVREEHGEQGRQKLGSPCPAGYWGSSPASTGDKVSHTALHAKTLLGSFPKNFRDFRITCIFPTQNHGKGTQVRRAVASFPTPGLS